MTESPLKRVFNFIVKYKSTHDGNSPSIREIGDGCGLSSTSHIRYLLLCLEEHGKIKVAGRSSRAIEVIGGEWKLRADN